MQQLERSLPGLRNRLPHLGTIRRGIFATRGLDRLRGRRGDHRRPRPLACRRHQHGGRSLALAQAWAAHPPSSARFAIASRPHDPFETRAEIARALGLAGDIVTDPGYNRRGLLEREHIVERRNAVGFRRGHFEPLAGIVQRAAADPADTPVDCMEDRKQQVAPSRCALPTLRGLRFARIDALAAEPPRVSRSQHGVDGLDLRRGRLVRREVQVH